MVYEIGDGSGGFKGESYDVYNLFFNRLEESKWVNEVKC